MLERREMIIPEEREYLESSLQDYNVVEGKNVAGPVNDSAEADLEGHLDLQNLDDDGIIKELTLENFDGSKFPVIGSSNGKSVLHSKRQQLHTLGTVSGSEGFLGGSVNKETCPADETFWEEGGSLSDFLTQKPHNDEVMASVTNKNSKANAGSALSLNSSGIRTKILSKSGFSQFFVKNTLTSKGVVCGSATPSSFGSDLPHQINTRYADNSKVALDRSVISNVKCVPPAKSVSQPEVSGVTLRDWLNIRDRRVKKAERLYLFTQITDIVKLYHSQGVSIPDLRPSSFRVSSSDQVFYIGSLSKRDLNLKCIEEDFSNANDRLPRKRELVNDELASASSHAKKGKHIQDSTVSGWWLQQSSRSNLKHEPTGAVAVSSCDPQGEAYKSCNNDTRPNSSETFGTSVEPGKSLLQLALDSDQLEESWYTTPEEGRFSLATNIYSLGVLLFELLCSFDSEKAHATAMSDLRYRILPPNFLAEYPQEVCLCLWLLHPEPSSRPTIWEVLQSHLINDLPNDYEHELSSSNESQSSESELLSHFLVIAKEQKEKAAMKLAEDLCVLEADIQDIERRQSRESLKPNSYLYRGSLLSRNSSASQPKFCVPHIAPQSHDESPLNDMGLFKNIRQLEGAYFSMRKNIQFPMSNHLARSEPALFNHRGAQYGFRKTSEEKKEDADPVGTFFDGLCKYARYSKFEVRGVLRNSEINTVNVICSLSFDRDQDYFAAAGVSKKIKIFDYRAFFNLSVDIHYPETEMLNQSKLNSICWNPYIKNYLASADYDGAVKLWDASTGVDFAQYTEHRKRAWSVDFSQSDPTKLASGSDDFSVKLWSITQKNCSATIKSHANICCVQFSPHSSNLLAFGSADYKAYCYDLRYTRSPWCTLAGHGKAVSNLKFIDSKTIVSASTDNTLKLWDLSKTTPDGQSINACTLTLGGHINEKNFVGLSVEDGFIACGSETNEVFTYYKSLPMPITTHKFGSIDPMSGKETFEENGHFVSSVCWRKNSDTIIAANSSGCIKVLQLV